MISWERIFFLSHTFYKHKISVKLDQNVGIKSDHKKLSASEQQWIFTARLLLFDSYFIENLMLIY